MSHLTLAIVVSVIAPARAQEPGDLQAGRTLARQICAECHAVSLEDKLSSNPRAPRFEAVAVTPGMTAAALNAFLHTSHRSMPNLLLSDDQASGVIAYILSLKK